MSDVSIHTFFDASELERLSAFIDVRPAGRPLFAGFLGMFMPDLFPSLSKALPRGHVAPDDIPIALFLEDTERLYEAYQQVDDDVPFAAAPFIYVPWMEAILGCPIYASESSMWAEPTVHNWDAWHWERPDLGSTPWARKLLEMTAALVEHSAGRYPVGQTLMRGVSDLLSALRGAANFTLDFLDHPEIMHRAADLCADVFVEVAQAQLELIPSSESGYISSGAHRAWAPEPMIWLQEDALSLLSPRLFREFILPQDRRILSQFAYTGFHLHGTATWAVDDLAALRELTVLNLCFESTRPDVEGTFEGFSRTQERGKALAAWKEFDGDPFWLWLDRLLEYLSPRGLMLEITVHSLEEWRVVRDGLKERGVMH